MSDPTAPSRGDMFPKSTAAIVTSRKSISRMGMRKKSYGFGGISSIKPVDRTSQLAIEFRRPPLMYLNTYQLEPKVKFDIEKVTIAVEEVLDGLFTDHKYNAQESPTLALLLAGELMRTVKGMGFDRYRVISVVTLAQKRQQSYNNAITFLWDHERDGYVDVIKETETAFLQATVFGIYLD